MKLTTKERRWILYDVGNSAFILLATAIIPIVFQTLARGALNEADYLAYWGYAVTIATTVVALLGPVLGAMSDAKKKRRAFFAIFAGIGIAGCAALPFTSSWVVFLVLYIIARIGFNGSLVFYDAMLIDITTDERMDHVSSLGFAWGYIGSCVPFIVSIALSLKPEKIGLTTHQALIIVFLLNALWWLAFTWPLLKVYEQKFTEPKDFRPDRIVRHFSETFREIRGQRSIYLFLLSFLFYIDGVYTIINMATAYGTSLGLSSSGLILALLVTQIVAFPCAIFFGRISKRYPTDRLIRVTIIAYFAIAVYAIFLSSLLQFWILAVAVGMFQGAIQALSRSYFAKIIPPEKSGEYFGIYDIFGKGASILGTLSVSLLTQWTGNQKIAIGSLSIMFLLGWRLFDLAAKAARTQGVQAPRTK